MVCQLRPLVYSLGLNNPPRICLTPRKLCVKNLWHIRNNFLANRSQVDCGLPSSALRLLWSSQACGNPLSNSYFCLWQSARRLFYSCNPRSKRRGLPQSAAHIWARNLARDWIPTPAMLHRESPCLKPHIFLPRDFYCIKYLRGRLFRPKLNTSGLSWYTFSWHYTFNDSLPVKCLHLTLKITGIGTFQIMVKLEEIPWMAGDGGQGKTKE
jgi:hypothetical protein